MTQVRLEPAALRSRVKHSTTEPLRSHTVWLGLVNPFLASDDLCGVLINFANSLDPDQQRQNVGPDLDPNRSTLMVILIFFVEKSADDNQSMKNYPACKELKYFP